MGLQVAAGLSGPLDDLDSELRLAAEAIGASVVPKLMGLRPRVVATQEEQPVLESLHLEGEGDPDGVMLAACMAAHAAYVSRRGEPDGLSVGALALARLLVWAQRAAIIGRPLEITWIGPPARLPDEEGAAHPVHAHCHVTAGGQPRRAEAVALVTEPG